MTSTQPGFVELVWRKEYECGHPKLDAQHRRLFEIGNALLDAVLTHQPKPEIERALGEFVDDIAHHFSTEEGILEACNVGVTEGHKEKHRRLLERANTLRTNFGEGRAASGELISFVVYDVIDEHISKEDTSWFALVKS